MSLFKRFHLERVLPFRSHFVTVAGHRLHYLDEGSGPVVICIHGNPTWGFYWRELVAALRDRFRVIVPDFIGCGLSDHPADQHFRAVHRVEHLQEFVDTLGLEKFSLVMHDWGGPLGTGFAVRNVERLERLVYLNTTITETESLPPVIKLAATPVIGKFLTRTTKRFLKLTTGWGAARKLPREIREAYYYPYRTAARRQAIWDFVDDIPFDSSHPTYAYMLELASKLPLLSHVPVQIIWGMQDICFHREMLGKVARHFPQARILEIPYASHLVMEDAPELVCSTAKSFLLEPTHEPVRETEGELESASAELARIRENRIEPNPFYAGFLEHAVQSPRQQAAIEPVALGNHLSYKQMSFAELHALVARYQRGLTELGLKANDRVLMLVSPGIEFLALSLAVMARGGIPILLDPGVGRRKLLRCIEEANPAVFIGSPKAQILPLLKRKLFKRIKFNLRATDIGLFGRPHLGLLKSFLPRPPAPQGNAGIALVAYTSGATGTPKGVVYTSAMVRAQFEMFRSSLGLEAGKKDLPLLPAFALYNIALGVTSVFPGINPSKPLNLEPRTILKLVNDLGINYSFGSPTLWNKIAEYCIRVSTTLPSLERVFMAGAPVSEAVRARVCRVVPNAVVATPYGATEALPVTLAPAGELNQLTQVHAASGELGTPVGRPVPGVDVRIIRRSTQAVAGFNEVEIADPLEIGEIVVAGSNISPEYLDRPEATLFGKIPDGDRIWHRMGDMGYRDDAGNLYFCGRKAHLVECRARVFFSVPVERVFNQHPKVKRCALLGLHRGSDVGIAVEPLPEHWPDNDQERERFIKELREIGAANPISAPIEHFFFHRSFPVDARHNAKIFRDKLSEWATELITRSSTWSLPRRTILQRRLA